MRKVFLIKFLFLILLTFAADVSAQTSAFTYQGKLTDMNSAANGQYDLTFRLFDALDGGTQIGTDAFFDNVSVTNGIFTATLDFGANAFATGAARFLEISVRTGTSTGAFTPLTPRQQITSSPFSLKSLSATSADSLSNSCVLCVTDAQIQNIDGSKISGIVSIANGGTGSSTQNFVDIFTNQTIFGNKDFVQQTRFFDLTANKIAINNNLFFPMTIAAALNVGTTVTAQQFSGSGAGLTNLNGANLTDGSISTAKIADGAVTENKLSSAPRQLLADARNSSLVGMLRWDLLKAQTFSLDTAPEGIVFDGENMWVGKHAFGSPPSVAKIRVSDGAILGNFDIGNIPRHLAFDGTNIWITLDGNRVELRRALDGEFQASLNINNPQGLAFDGANMWIAFGSNSVRKIRIDFTNSEDFAVGNNPSQVAFDGENIWVTSSAGNNVTKLRASDGMNLGSFNVANTSFGVVFDGVNIWISYITGNRIRKLRASDGANLGEVVIGDAGNVLRGIAFDGANIWVVNRTNGNVTVIRAVDNVNLGTFPTGIAPFGIAFDGSRVWVTNNNSRSVTRMSPFPR